MRKLRNNRRDVMRADGRKRLDRLFDEFEFVDWEQRDVMREFMIEQSVTNTPGLLNRLEAYLRATYKQEYKPLTTPAKKAILKDFGKWSGGEDPAVCDEELVEKYLTFAVSKDYKRSEIRAWLLELREGED
jgi:hypothetical protein